MNLPSSRTSTLKGLGLGVAAVATVFVMLAVFRRATEEKSPAVAASDLAGIKLKSAEEAAAEQALAEKGITARLAREYFLHQVQVVEADVSALDEEVRLWNQEVEAMLTNDTGRRVAAKDQSARNFQVMYERKKPDPNKARSLRASLDLLKKQVESVPSGKEIASLYAPSERLKAELAAIGGEASSLLREQKQVRLDILALGQGQAPAAMTLKQKLEELEGIARESRMNAIREAEEAAFDEATKALAKAKGEAVREEEKVKLDEVNRQIADSKKQQRLEEVRKKTELLALMTPLTAKGNLQPNGKRTLDKEPVSYSQLVGGGYLVEDFAPLERFTMFLHYPKHNDRPTWNFGGVRINGATFQQLSDAKQMQIREIQRFVKEYGLELVELGYLSK